jgi:formylmethanofuran dehydrogenase subunit C
MRLRTFLPIAALLLPIALMTSCKDDDQDDGTPTVLETSPAKNATDVARNQMLTVTFSEDMDPSTITASTFTLNMGEVSIDGEVLVTGDVATFTPSTTLAAGEDFTASISTAAKSATGMALQGMHEWNFSTGMSFTTPVVKASSPENNAIDIALNQVVTVTFSEIMAASTINATTFTLKQGDVSIDGVVAVTGAVATFTPNEMLAEEADFTATISTEATSATGIALENDHVFEFSTGNSTHSVEAVDLGTAGDYVILAKSAINNSSTSAVTGDLGLSPAATTFITGLTLTDFTGYATSAQVTGKVYAADMADPTPINLTTAVENMITAYNDAAGRSMTDFVELGAGDISGKILTTGIYKWSNTVLMSGDVTISGSSTDVWIFQIAEDLTVGSGAKIILAGGAQASNIFWQVTGQATLGTTSHFEGTILSKTGVTLLTGATYNGKIFAQTAVILDSNEVIYK